MATEREIIEAWDAYVRSTSERERFQRYEEMETLIASERQRMRWDEEDGL